MQISNLTAVADALHQMGRLNDAQTRYREAQEMQAIHDLKYPLLYGIGGFRYCTFLLSVPERASWQIICSGALKLTDETVAHGTTLQDVVQRAEKMFEWRKANDPLHSIAVEHLTMGRAILYQPILEKSDIQSAKSEIDQAVSGFHRSGRQDLVPFSLLTRAWLRLLSGNTTDAKNDLDDAWNIAERGPMKLFMADIHLYRARLFFREKAYPWGSPREDLASAEKLINDCGYHRRDEELADAKKAILGK